MQTEHRMQLVTTKQETPVHGVFFSRLVLKSQPLQVAPDTTWAVITG